MTPQDRAKVAVVAAPTVIGLALMAFAVLQRGHFVQDTKDRQQVETKIAGVLRQLATEQAQPIGRQAAVSDLPGEENSFLTLLRVSAQSTGVKIVRWSANQRMSPAAVNGGKPIDPALNGIQPVSGMLEIAGPYNSILAFAHQFESASRLLNLTTIGWNRPDVGNDVHLSALVTRYVIPPPPAPATPSAPAPTNS